MIESYRKSSYSGTDQGSDCVEVGLIGRSEAETA
jgi:Domain of unknown function (DUF397)